MNKNLIAAALIPLVLTLTACGGGGGSDDGGVNPTPTPINKAPILSQIENKATYQDTAIEIALTASDSNGDKLTYSTSLSNNANFEVDISDGILHITPINQYFGDEVITVNVSDGELEDSTDFALQVLQISIPPIAQIKSDELSTPPPMPAF
jgi:hypothetical protein